MYLQRNKLIKPGLLDSVFSLSLRVSDALTKDFGEVHRLQVHVNPLPPVLK